MTRLNKIQEYAIHWLDHNGYGCRNISEELNISEISITKFLEKNKVFNTKTNIKISSSSAGKVKDRNLIIVQQKGQASIRDKSAIFKPMKEKNKRK
jgi:orotate phosphoribosyltransferase-like protein